MICRCDGNIMVKLRWWEPWDPNQTIAWEPEGHFPPPPQLYSTLEPHQQRVRKLVISNLTLIVIGGRWSAVRGVGWEEDKENIWVCLMLWWSLWTQWSRLMTMKKPDYVLTTKYIFTVQPPTHPPVANMDMDSLDLIHCLPAIWSPSEPFLPPLSN